MAQGQYPPCPPPPGPRWGEDDGRRGCSLLPQGLLSVQSRRALESTRICSIPCSQVQGHTPHTCTARSKGASHLAAGLGKGGHRSAITREPCSAMCPTGFSHPEQGMRQKRRTCLQVSAPLATGSLLSKQETPPRMKERHKPRPQETASQVGGSSFR